MTIVKSENYISFFVCLNKRSALLGSNNRLSVETDYTDKHNNKSLIIVNSSLYFFKVCSLSIKNGRKRSMFLPSHRGEM